MQFNFVENYGNLSDSEIIELINNDDPLSFATNVPVNNVINENPNNIIDGVKFSNL